MFRRFGTPFAVDWLAKNVNGYVYTTAIPADPQTCASTGPSTAPATARACRATRLVRGRHGHVPGHRPAGLRRALRRLVAQRLRPEMERNFAYLEERLDEADRLSLAEMACVLEDAIDIHDRHWKIHWMLNFAQLSATLNLRAVMEKTRGSVDEQLLGRLQNSASDRNWDSIEALWRMKNEVRDDAGSCGLPSRARPRSDRRAAVPSERGRRFIAERVEPYQREFGWHAVWSHEFIYPTAREEMEPVLELVRGYLDTDYDYPTAIEAMRRDIEAASHGRSSRGSAGTRSRRCAPRTR